MASSEAHLYMQKMNEGSDHSRQTTRAQEQQATKQVSSAPATSITCCRSVQPAHCCTSRSVNPHLYCTFRWETPYRSERTLRKGGVRWVKSPAHTADITSDISFQYKTKVGVTVIWFMHKTESSITHAHARLWVSKDKWWESCNLSPPLPSVQHKPGQAYVLQNISYLLSNKGKNAPKNIV